ncbi:MAG: monovalent cation/H+ antiporter complex subunit F [Oscillospiraceae bacterium]
MEQNAVLIGCAVAMTVFVLATLVRCLLGPRFTDRVVAVNMINTMVLGIIVILSVVLDEDYLVDIALVYALLSFLAVVVLAKLVKRYQREEARAQEEEERDAT